MAELPLSRTGILLLVLSLSVGTAPAVGRECSAAKRFYEEALQVEDVWQRLALLNRSLKVCETYEAWYAKAEVLEKQGRLRDAAVTFRKARNERWRLDEKTVSLEQEQLALGRAAAAYARAGDGCQADLTYRAAKGVSTDRTPRWLDDEQKEFLMARSQRVVSAEEIECVLVQSKSIGVEPVIDLSNVHFGLNKADLTPTAKAQVTELGEALARLVGNGSTQQRIRLVGHADERGEPEYNMGLSIRRAEAVFKQLNTEHPELASRLVHEGHGEEELLIVNAQRKDEHQLNRRVEIKLE